jgi:eukaryotic-like serine/threonine-protein kinase
MTTPPTGPKPSATPDVDTVLTPDAAVPPANDATAPPTEFGGTQPFDGSAANPAATEFTGRAADVPENTRPSGAHPRVNLHQSVPPAAASDGLTLGDFKLVKKLGEGGMGTVFRALQVSLDREVAVKVLAQHLAANPDFVQRFQREAKIMAKIDHPNVLRCYAFGENQGLHYFAMEYVDGGSLEGWVQRLGRLSVGDTLHVLIACAHAMQHAHEMDLVHRDLKPDNILLTKKGVVKVADLGLAKALSDDLGLTKTGTGAGTPFYMAPEQSRDVKHVDARADIYALGVMLYYCLTGEVPFKGETVVDLYAAKEKGKFTPARQFNDEVPERLDLILDKTLARKPEHRYQTCTELAADLEALGLASPSLSFAPQASSGSHPSVRPTVPQKTKAIAPRPSGATPKVPPKPASKPPAKPLEKTRMAAPEADVWFLSFRTKEDKLVKRRMTTSQVLVYIKSADFDVKAQASKTLDGVYRLLATYHEFEPALRGKVQHHKAERKAAQFHAVYEKLEKEEARRHRYRWFRNLFRGTVSWIGLVVYIALIVGGIALAVWAFRAYAWPYVDAWFQKVTQ